MNKHKSTAKGEGSLIDGGQGQGGEGYGDVGHGLVGDGDGVELQGVVDDYAAVLQLTQVHIVDVTLEY